MNFSVETFLKNFFAKKIIAKIYYTIKIYKKKKCNTHTKRI